MSRTTYRDTQTVLAIRAGIAVLLAVLLGLALGLAPQPAEAAGVRIRGDVDVCVMRADFPKRWTRGVERKLNREFEQRIDVRRIREDRFAGCDVIVWWSGERRAFDHVAGDYSPTGPVWHQLSGTEWNMFDIEINVGSDGIRGKSGKATLTNALRQAGIR